MMARAFVMNRTFSSNQLQNPASASTLSSPSYIEHGVIYQKTVTTKDQTKLSPIVKQRSTQSKVEMEFEISFHSIFSIMSAQHLSHLSSYLSIFIYLGKSGLQILINFSTLNQQKLNLQLSNIKDPRQLTFMTKFASKSSKAHKLGQTRIEMC